MSALASAIERRSWAAEELRVSQEDGATRVSWYPAIFDSLSEDLGGFRETIARRAFTKTIQEQDIRALVNHNPDAILGRNKSGTLDLKVDLRGLRASVTLPDTQYARDLAVSVERGDITAGSFGFSVVDDTWGTRDGEMVRELKQVRLFDVSLVTYPAYPGTDGSAALRMALAGVGNVDDLVHPLLMVRAGLPLDPEQRSRFKAVIDELAASVSEPLIEPPDEPEIDWHSAAEARRRRLTLLRIGGN